MAPTRRPLVRKRPLMERLRAYLNPWDFLLWVSEEVETRDLGSKSLGTKLGVALNFIFLLASANSRYVDNPDDVFRDSATSGWGPYLATTIVWVLGAFSAWNLFSTLSRTRSYRLFEASVEQKLETPSAHRVRVQSTPAASSPLRILADVLYESAESRAHPDKTRDVWELRLWDPLPASLQLVCLFSPFHVFVYLLNFPLPPLASRPSVTVFNCIVQQVAWSGLLLFLQARFSQQNKDSATIQKWVMREYDTKYVHPRLHPVVRDASTQCGVDDEGHFQEFAGFGTPTTVISRGFQTHPNQNYSKHFDPDNIGAQRKREVASPVVFTPPSQANMRDAETSTVARTGRQSIRQSMPANALATAPDLPKPLARASVGPNFGGSLGVYSHHNSPLRKATSLEDMREDDGYSSPIRNSRQMAASEQKELADRMVRRHSPAKQNLSPFKEKEDRPRLIPHYQSSEASTSPNPFANIGKHRADERFPKRRY